MENGPSFRCFGSIGEESVDPGANDNGEVFRGKGVFEPFKSASLSGAFFLGCVFEDRVAGGVEDRSVGFEEVVGESRVVPPRVVLAQLVVQESKVGHWVLFIPGFLEVSPLRFPGARYFGGSYHGGLQADL